MKKNIRNRFKLFFLSLQLVVCSGYGQVVVKTVIPATITSDRNLIVTNQNGGSLNFDLSSLPKGADIKSSKLQLVLQEDVRQKMLLDVRTLPAKTRIFNKELGILNKKESVIDLNIDPKFYNLPATKQLSIGLQTIIKNEVRAAFYPASVVNVSNAPRLIISYSTNQQQLPNWASLRGNAQHTAQTLKMFQGATPTDFVIKEIGNLGAIQSDLVMGNNLIYAVSNEGSITKMYAIDPISKNQFIIADNLNATSFVTTPVLDPFGRLYYFSENEIKVFDLTANNSGTKIADVNTSDKITASPTAGPDGSLYVSSANNISAYRSFGKNQTSPLLWQYNLDGKKSAVTLNNNGTIAYVLSHDQKKIISINANNGRKIAERRVFLQDYSTTESSTVPLVNSNGFVYMTSKLNNADSLYILDENLKLVKSFGGGKFSSAAMANDGSIYFVKGDSLVNVGPKKAYRGVNKLPNAPSVRSVVTDLSNNVYILTSDKMIYNYLNKENRLIKVPVNLKDGSGNDIDITQGNMIIAPDGSLYAMSSSKIYTIRSNKFDNEYTLTDGDKYTSNVSFRGNKIIVPEKFTLTNKKQLVGVDAVLINNGVTIAKDAIVSIQSAGGITFKPGFKINAGATLSCKTGY
ncbi:MAG: hypothetical protein ACO1N7_02525 [Sphingobacteriaceae bacterium]